MDFFTVIDTRVSAAMLKEPAPSREHIERILSAGGRAPDHGRIAPWRIAVLTGAARETLAEAMVASLKSREPGSDQAQLDRVRNTVMGAPCVIAVAAHATEHPKVPAVEQLVAVGAAVQNMFLAAHALGYGVQWKTGPASYDPAVKQALGFEAADTLVALLYVGDVKLPGKVREPVLAERVRWL